jgi:hypothetical protein
VFPVRYELDLYIKLWRNSVFRGLTHKGENLHICCVCECVERHCLARERVTLLLCGVQRTVGRPIDRCSLTLPESQWVGHATSHLRCLRAPVRHVTSWRGATESNDGVCSLSLSLSDDATSVSPQSRGLIRPDRALSIIRQKQ